jgi:hypothetical protein
MSAEMPTQLDALPVEMVAHVALFLNRHRCRRWHSHPIEDNCLLALRCVSRTGLDAVRRAIKNHPLDHVRFENGSGAQKITAVGKVLGSGCRRLCYAAALDAQMVGPEEESPEALDALRQFVVDTQGRLRELKLNCSSISTQLFLEICSGCPQLKLLEAYWGLEHATWTWTSGEADLDDFAAALSRACPLLETVEIQRAELVSTAETYAMHFPNLKFLNFEVEELDPGYAPSRFDKIEAAAQLCVGAEELGLSRCTVSAALAERLLRTPLQSRIKSLYFGFAEVSDQTLLRLAAGLKALREIIFPFEFSGSPEFFISLARARPALKKLSFEAKAALIDDACVAAMCESFALEALSIFDNSSLTPAVVDIILRSPTAETLLSADFYHNQALTSAGILRLVRGCPRLRNVTWYGSGLTPLGYDSLDGTLHGKNVDDLNALLKARGSGRAINPFKKFGPNPLPDS